MPTIDFNARFGSYPSRYKSTSVDELVVDEQAHQVNMVCVASTTGSFFSDTEGNAETLEACGRYPGYLVPIGTVNPKTAVNPASAVTQIVNSKFRAVRFYPNEQAWPVDFAVLNDLVIGLAESNIVSIISCTKPGDATAIGRLVKSNSNGKSTSVVLASIDSDTFAEAVSVMRASESIMIETHSLRFPDGLSLLRDNVGSHRILFSSGASAQSIGAAMEYVTSSGLSDADKEKIMGSNAALILGLS